MISNLTDKVAVITGGTSGIGLALARACLDEGMHVAITGSRDESVGAAAAELEGGSRLHAVVSDAGDAAAAGRLAAEVEERLGPVDLLCVNAGVARLAAVPQLTVAEWDRAVSVNLSGAFYAVHAFLPQLECRPEAHITITSSVFGFFSAALQAPYFATKAGLNAFAEALHYDLMLAESSVGVSLVAPGNTRTNMAEAGLTGDEPAELAEMIRAELEAGTDPGVVAQAALDAVRDERFYVFPNTGDFQPMIEARFDRVLSQRNPTAADVGDAI